tara:strand:- start:22048 stop:22515 length:468 start_codon:yes stop_codon:yes gene_type:complete
VDLIKPRPAFTNGADGELAAIPAATALAPAVEFAAAAEDRPIWARWATVVGIEVFNVLDDEEDSWRNAIFDHGLLAIEDDDTPNVGGAPRHACVAAGKDPLVPELLHARAASATQRPPRAADRIANARRAVPSQWVTSQTTSSFQFSRATTILDL